VAAWQVVPYKLLGSVPACWPLWGFGYRAEQ